MAEWTKPTGFIDPGNDWADEAQAYDGELGAGATSEIAGDSWSNYLNLTISTILCPKIRYYAQFSGANPAALIDVDVFYSGGWHHIYQGTYNKLVWIEKTLGANYSVTAMRFRIYNPTVQSQTGYILEAEFYEILVPTVTTQAASNITHNSATGNGNITDIGGENCTRRGFCYMEGTSGDPTTANSVAYDDGSFGTGAYTKSITGLTKGTNYRIRAYVVNSAGTGYGTTVQILTDSEPTVTTEAVSDIGTITAIGNGDITAINGDTPTKRGICWNTTGNPDVNDSKSEEIGSFGTGAFTRPITGLIRGEEYHVRAYAYNSAGYGYSSDVTFYTYPTVTTQTPTDIKRADPTTLTANGLIELDVVEDITTRGFKYGETEADTWDESENGGGTYTEGAFSLTIDSNIVADTTYYIRAYATGAWGTKYGSYLEFKTAYPYGPNKTEIKSEATAGASDIAAVGGKRSLTIENHLIQNQTIADIISAGYLANFKDQKTKLVVTKPCPAPYEIGDTIRRGAGIPYAPAASAVISYTPAATAVHPYELAGHDMLIRKISISFSAGNYVSIIELES